MEERFYQYLDIIPTLNYQQITNDNDWEVIDDIEGLTEEFGIYDRNRWFIAELPITDYDSASIIKEFKGTNDNMPILNQFNLFDIELKNRYNMKYIDLIDYNNGIVRIITYK